MDSKEVVPAAAEAATPPKAAAAAGPKKIKGSFKFVCGYARRECCQIIFGMFFLMGGMIADLVVPLFIGRVVDLINEDDYDGVGEICLYMIIVIFVSSITFRTSWYSTKKY